MDGKFDKWLNRAGAIAALAAIVVGAICTPLVGAWWREQIADQTKDFARQSDVAAIQQSVAKKSDLDSVALDLASYKKETTAILNGINTSLAGINTTLAVIQQKLLNDDRQDHRLDDLETRLRAVEKLR